MDNNQIKPSIFDLKVGDFVFIRHKGAIVQAKILEMVTEVKFPYAEPRNGHVSTDAVLLLATGEKLTVENYCGHDFPNLDVNVVFFLNQEDCIHSRHGCTNHVRSDIQLACKFIKHISKYFGLKIREYGASRFHGAGIDHVYLYKKHDTHVDEIAYDGIIYRHDGYDNITFTTKHYTFRDTHKGVNGTLKYLQDKYAIYSTEKAAYDALTPRVITFADNSATEPIKVRVTQIYEVEVDNMEQVKALTASVMGNIKPYVITADIVAKQHD